MSQSIDKYTQAWQDNSGPNPPPPKPIVPVITTTSWDDNAKVSNASKQADLIALIHSSLYASQQQLYGVAVHEYSDEWWRSDLSRVGIDLKGEGCPNSNAYAHTSCGIVTIAQAGNGLQTLFALEYSGMFEIMNIPFRFCVVPKESARRLESIWSSGSSGNNPIPPPFTTSFPAGSAYCSFIPAVVPWVYVIPILSGLSVTVILLLLLLPAPKPPTPKARELKAIRESEDFLVN